MIKKRELLSFIGIGTGSFSEKIYNYIRVHPEVSVPEEAIDFFCNHEKYTKGVDWYEGFFQKDEDKKQGELSNHYLQNYDSAELIAKTYPDANLIAVIDNPILALKLEYIRSKDRKKRDNYTFEQFISVNKNLLKNFLYGQQLVSFFSFYSSINLKVIILSDLNDRPLEELKSVYEHIGVDSGFVPADLKHLMIDDEADSGHKGLIKRMTSYIKEKIKTLLNFLNDKLKPKKITLSDIDKANRLIISKELEVELKEYYKQDIKVISNLLHRDFAEEWG
ncbi:MAG: hypothetical protein R3B60_00155 [Candidatus Paceibacterota bacterium]